MTLIDTRLYVLLMELWHEAEGLAYTAVSEDAEFRRTIEQLDAFRTAQQAKSHMSV